MSRVVRATPQAQTDIEDAFRWYERAQPGLGAAFLDSLEEAVDVLGVHPEAFGKVHRNVRRILLRRFPYGLFYVIEGNEVVIIGCFHARRDPNTWIERAEDHDEA